MRYMIIIKADEKSEAGIMPAPKVFEDMARYNEQLMEAGVLLAGEGLLESAKGARVKRVGTGHVVKDGPFTETKELVAGFWILDVKSRDEALEWAKRIPLDEGEEVEVRKVAEASDFEGVMSPEAIAREEAMRDALGKRTAD